MAKSNMGIADVEFSAAANTITDYANKLIQMITDYQNAVKTICNTAIEDPVISNGMYAICQQVETLKEPLGTISEEISRQCRAYIDSIDQADRFMY